MTGVGAGLHFEPGSPLVQKQVNPALRVILVHHFNVAAKNVLDLNGFRKYIVVLLVSESSGRTLPAPIDDCIVVQGNAVHTLAGEILHKHLGPVVVVVRSSGGHFVQTVVAVVAKVGAIAAEKVGVVLGSHIASAAPGLVADAEVLYLPGLLAAVGPSEVSHTALRIGSHILHPVGHLLDASAAHVAADIGLDAEHFAEIQELVGSEAVVLQGSAPVVVGDVGSLLLGSYAVHPVIIVSKTSSGPAHYRHFEGLEGIEHILAVAFDIRHFRVLAYPKSPIDAPSEVLRELSVDFLGNGIAGAFIVNPDSCILRVKSDCAENGNNCRDGF